LQFRVQSSRIQHWALRSLRGFGRQAKDAISARKYLSFRAKRARRKWLREWQEKHYGERIKSLNDPEFKQLKAMIDKQRDKMHTRDKYLEEKHPIPKRPKNKIQIHMRRMYFNDQMSLRPLMTNASAMRLPQWTPDVELRDMMDDDDEEEEESDDESSYSYSMNVDRAGWKKHLNALRGHVLEEKIPIIFSPERGDEVEIEIKSKDPFRDLFQAEETSIRNVVKGLTIDTRKEDETSKNAYLRLLSHRNEKDECFDQMMIAPLSAPAGTLREARKLRHSETLLTQMKMDESCDGSVSWKCTKYFTFRISRSRPTRLELRTRQGKTRLLVSRCTLPSVTDNEWSSSVGLETTSSSLLLSPEADDTLFRIGKFYVGVYGISQEDSLFDLEVTQFKIRTPLPLSKSLLRVQSYIKKFNTLQKAFNDEDEDLEEENEEDRKKPEVAVKEEEDNSVRMSDLFDFREKTPRRRESFEDDKKKKKFVSSFEDKWKVEQRKRALEMKRRVHRFLRAYKSPSKNTMAKRKINWKG
jgi:hypothetical protein